MSSWRQNFKINLCVKWIVLFLIKRHDYWGSKPRTSENTPRNLICGWLSGRPAPLTIVTQLLRACGGVILVLSSRGFLCDSSPQQQLFTVRSNNHFITNYFLQFFHCHVFNSTQEVFGSYFLTRWCTSWKRQTRASPTRRWLGHLNPIIWMAEQTPLAMRCT